MSKKGLIPVFFLSLFVVTVLRAQDVKLDQGTVMYDPLFWRSDLRIRGEQAQRIEAINMDYYEHLLTAVQDESSSGNSLATAVVESTRVRNQRILDTFLPHQRRKWQKILLGYNQ